MLNHLTSQSTINVASDAILGLYERHSVLSDLFREVSETQDGLTLSSDSTTARKLNALTTDPLYPWLGPLSRLLAIALSQATLQLAPVDLASATLQTPLEATTSAFFPRIRALSRDMETAWLASPLAGADESQIAKESQELTKKLWNVFKSFIFSSTMAFDSLIESLIDMCPSPTITVPADPSRKSGLTGKWPPVSSSNLPPQYLKVVQSILQTYGHLYWIVGNFGAAGFTAYTRVFYSSLDILGRDAEQCVALLEMTEPASSQDGKLVMNDARRSGVTYFFDVAEQLAGSLPDDLIEARLLPSCRP